MGSVMGQQSPCHSHAPIRDAPGHRRCVGVSLSRRTLQRVFHAEAPPQQPGPDRGGIGGGLDLADRRWRCPDRSCDCRRCKGIGPGALPAELAAAVTVLLLAIPLSGRPAGRVAGASAQ